jgi:uncharacterized membrane protein YhaH (DUF805 family)
MGVQEAVMTCLANYVGFGGRASRPECWWWVLFVIAGVVILRSLGDFIWGVDSGAGAVSGGLFSLVTLMPGLAVIARRLHDTDNTAWWSLLLLIPVFGWGALCYLLLQPGEPGPNRFGDGL